MIAEQSLAFLYHLVVSNVWGERDREIGSRQYGASPCSIHTVNNPGGDNYIWVATKQWALCVFAWAPP